MPEAVVVPKDVVIVVPSVRDKEVVVAPKEGFPSGSEHGAGSEH